MPEYWFWSNEAIRTYLLAHVEEVPGGCWIWKLGLDRRGYGLCQVNGLKGRAARIAFEAFVEPIPKGLNDIHHVCENPRCICPDHLLPMTHGDHLRLHAISGTWAGERNSQAKLTEADVQFIKVAADFISVKNLAAQFNVTERQIFNIKKGDSWPHVGEPNIPERSLPEIRQHVQATAKRALGVLLNLQKLRRKRGQAQPPDLEECIYFTKICAAL